MKDKISINYLNFAIKKFCCFEYMTIAIIIAVKFTCNLGKAFN